MNIPTAEAHWTKHDGYIAVFRPSWTSQTMTLKGANGKPRSFRDRWEAEAHAWRALYAEECRVYALRHDPDQIKETPMVFQARSAAGRRRVAEQRLKEAMREAAE